MSLQSFQRAVVELTLAPWKSRALRQGDSGVLAGYDLTCRERDRIVDIVGQPGISVHCTLSRGNRFEVIHGVFPMTCVLLRPKLRQVLDEHCQEHRPANYQLEGEQTAFAAIVSRKIAAGELVIEYLPEIFAYEMACMDLGRRMQMQNDPDAAVQAIVEFQHSPNELLPPLSRRSAPPSGLPKGSYRARVKLQGEQFQVELLHP